MCKIKNRRRSELFLLFLINGHYFLIHELEGDNVINEVDHSFDEWANIMEELRIKSYFSVLCKQIKAMKISTI